MDRQSMLVSHLVSKPCCCPAAAFHHNSQHVTSDAGLLINFLCCNPVGSALPLIFLTKSNTIPNTLAWFVGDLNLIKVPSDLSDNQVLFLSDILATGWHATELGNVHDGDSVAIWGCGPGQFFWPFECLGALALHHFHMDVFPHSGDSTAAPQQLCPVT